MNRNQFLKAALATAVTVGTGESQAAKRKAPLAITMWDFSWLERRWPGAGYEDWDQALDELLERGYNAIRIDAYPHLVAAGAEKEWTLLPPWTTQEWGSPDINRVRVMPALLEFLQKCRKRKIKVGLSSWFREDEENTRLTIAGPENLARIWSATLKHIDSAGLMNAVLYVDLCNEWPLDAWAPFFKGVPPGTSDWNSPASIEYVNTALDTLRRDFPTLPLLFSYFNTDADAYRKHDVSRLDAFEHHIWMAQQAGGEFYREVGYQYERYDLKGYRNLSLKSESAYRKRPDYWRNLLTEKIKQFGQVSRDLGKPLMTTECWGVVDYKDWPLLKWDWVKELNEAGVKTASATGQWVAIATSNFCGPQFRGMWRDVAWHRSMTQVIRSGDIDASIRQGRLWDRL